MHLTSVQIFVYLYMSFIRICRLLSFGFLSFFTLSCGDDDDSGTGNGNGNGNGDEDDFTCETLVEELALPNSVNIFGLGHLTEDDQSLYIYTYSEADGGAIIQVLKADGTTSIVADNLGGVNNLMVDNAYIYWLEYDLSSSSGMVRKSRVSTTNEVETLAEGFPKQPDGSDSPYDVFFPNGLTISDGYLYWGEEVGGFAIRKISVDGGAVSDIGRGEDLKPMALNADAENIYMLDAENNSQLVSFKKSDSTMTVLSSGFATTQAFSNLELANNMLYWTEITDEGSAWSFNLTDDNRSTIKEGMTNPRNILIEESNIFIAAGNGIFLIESDGTEIDVACSGINVPHTIAVDDREVFIVDKPNTAAIRGQIVKWTEN